MSEKTHILITMPFPETLIEQVKKSFPQLQVTQHPANTPKDIPDKVWEQTQVLYTNHVLPSVERAPNLHWIQFHWAGIDSLLGHPVLLKENLIATTLSGAHASQMGEYVVLMLLALGHKLPSLVAHQGSKNWPEARWKKFMPRELRESTVGIVGYGSIGRQVARLLQQFGATILATKGNAMQPEDIGYIPEGMGDRKGELVRRLYPAKAVKSMLKECDFVVVAVPLTAENRNLIGEEELAVMKPTAYLVDVSRGGIIDHQALLAALNRGAIAGAALDVFPTEPLPENSPLWKLPNLLITPHISGVTPLYDERAMDLFITNIKRYLAGEPLYNKVDINKGY